MKYYSDCLMYVQCSLLDWWSCTKWTLKWIEIWEQLELVSTYQLCINTYGSRKAYWSMHFPHAVLKWRISELQSWWWQNIWITNAYTYYTPSYKWTILLVTSSIFYIYIPITIYTSSRCLRPINFKVIQYRQELHNPQLIPRPLEKRKIKFNQSHRPQRHLSTSSLVCLVYQLDQLN